MSHFFFANLFFKKVVRYEPIFMIELLNEFL